MRPLQIFEICLKVPLVKGKLIRPICIVPKEVAMFITPGIVATVADVAGTQAKFGWFWTNFMFVDVKYSAENH